VAAMALAAPVLLVAMPANAQAPVTVTPGFDTTWLPRNAAIELKLSQPVPPDVGRIAVFIGTTDLTAAFAATADRLRYRPGLLLLPAGESDVIVYLFTAADKSQEIGRFPLRVLTGGGFEKAEIAPQLELNLKGQVAEGHTPADNAPPRGTFQDLTGTAGEQSTHTASGWSLRTQVNAVGVTYRPDALRYGELANSAPPFDLADYLVVFDRGGVNVSLGGVSFGGNRLLLNHFGSRGLTTALHFGLAHLALAAMNGTSIVGWSNPVGLDNADHRILAADLGVELVPARPGALAAQVSLVDGSLLPRTGYTQGAVVDAERSRGGGFHVSASDAAQRIRIDAGYARSEFTNPDNPTLSQGSTIVLVKQTTNDARYADVILDVFHALPFTRALTATFVATYHHERVDPLYRSVGGTARADYLQNGIDVATTVGPVSAQVSHSQGGDNLDDIPSLLKTLTRTTGANLAVPLASLLRTPSATWLPALSYAYNNIHQFGDHLPVGGGFSPSDVPDQANVNQTLAAQWTGSSWHAGYQLGVTSQQNRQVGGVELNSVTHAVALGVTPAAALDVSVDLALETAKNTTVPQETTTQRIGGSINWKVMKTSALAASLSVTHSMDDPRTTEQTNTDLQLEFSQQLNMLRWSAKRQPGQLFVRYARHSGNLIMPSSLTAGPRLAWTINTGLTVHAF
jgi:hypothetical protein